MLLAAKLTISMDFSLQEEHLLPLPVFLYDTPCERNSVARAVKAILLICIDIAPGMLFCGAICCFCTQGIPNEKGIRDLTRVG